MTKKLYRVKVDLYVMAEDEWDAQVAATQAKFDTYECMAREADTLIPGWEDAVPYNSSDDRTCAEIFANPGSIKRFANYPVGRDTRA